MAPNGSENQAPEFRLRVDGTDLPVEVAADVIEVEVLLDVSAPSMFAVRMKNWDPDKFQVTWADDSLFAEGAEVEILMGYMGSLTPVMIGEVTGLEPEFRATEVPMVTIRGYDRRHRLMRGKKTRSFTKIKDSDIAAKVAQEAGLTPETDDTKVELEYVMQHNQTDLEFLEERASRLGYEVFVEDKTLKFRRPPYDEAEKLTLKRNADLLEFCPRASTIGLAGESEARGWSPQDKKALTGKAAAGSLGSMGGSASGLAVADKAFDAAIAVSVSWPVLSQGEADQVAEGQQRKKALSYVTGEGVAIGRADLQAGTVIKIEGYGERFSGRYYLRSVAHTYSPKRGYYTAFTLRRLDT